MSIAEKLTTIAENEQRVHDAGYDSGYSEGKQAEYDRFWDGFQQDGNRKNYWYGFAGPGWTQETLNPKHKIEIVDGTQNAQYAVGMFYRCGCELQANQFIDFSKIADKFDFSKAQRATDMFNSAHITNVIADFSSAVYANTAFANTWGTGVSSLTLKVSELLQNVSQMFYNPNLTRIEMMEGSVWAVSVAFNKCSKLDKVSHISIVDALSTTTSGLTVTFNKAAVNAAFGINVDDPTTYPEGSEFYELRYSRPNWTFSYGS